jgi:hypothetical protein
MTVQKVSDELDAALRHALQLADTSIKHDVVTHLTAASSALTEFSEAILATLNDMDKRLSNL